MKQELMKILCKILDDKSSEIGSNEKMDLILAKLEKLEKPFASESQNNDHLLINEVCELTRKSRVTIWSWSKKDILKPIGKSGKNPIYLKSDVLNFLYKKQNSN